MISTPGRRAPAALAMFVAFALIAAACDNDASSVNPTTGPATATTTTTAPSVSSTGPPSTATVTTTPSVTTTRFTSDLRPYGGEAVIGTTLEPPTLNIFAPGGFSAVVSLIGNGYWVGVQDIDGFTLELIPDVVTELPTVANSGLTMNPDGSETIRYTIRDEAQWADGTPISGADFEFTYETIMDPALPIVRTVYEDIIPESVVAGDKTFEFTLRAPTVQAELIFGVVLPKHDIQGSEFINDYNDTMWMSGGPFEFERWSKGEFISLTRNPNYWKTDPDTGQELPYLDRVVFRFMPNTASLLDAFEAHDLDVINPPPTIDTIEELLALESEGARIEVLPGPVWEQLGFQFGENRFRRNRNSYNAFLEYRQAVAHAIDKDKIVDQLYNGQLEAMSSYVDAFSPTISQGAWDQYDYDLDKARQLLADLCARSDTDCEANPVTAVATTNENNEQRVELSSMLSDMFEDAGITYEVILEPPSIFFGETVDFGLYDLGLWAWKNSSEFAALSSLLAIHDLWDPEAAPRPGSTILNTYRWGTPLVEGMDPAGFNQTASAVIDRSTARFVEVRDLMEATVDKSELVALVNEAENILADNVVFIPLYQQPTPGAVWADEIGGYRHAPSIVGDTWNVDGWYRSDLAD